MSYSRLVYTERSRCFVGIAHNSANIQFHLDNIIYKLLSFVTNSADAIAYSEIEGVIDLYNENSRNGLGSSGRIKMTTSINTSQMVVVSKVQYLLLMLVLLAVSSFANAESGGKIDLQIGAFQAPQFKTGDGEFKPLKDGSDYDPEFIKMINSNPEAKAKLDHAETYGGVTLAGSVVILAGTIVLLQDTLDQKDSLDNNQLPQDDSSKQGQALGLVIVGGVIALVGSSGYRSDISEAVDIYNRGVGSAANNDVDLPKKAVKPSYSLALSADRRSDNAGLMANLKLSF